MVVSSLTANTGNTSAGSTIDTASVSPPANAYLVLWIAHGVSGGTSVTGVTGLGLTWSQKSVKAASTSIKLECWVAQCGGSAPTPGVITITTATTAVNVCWDVVQVTGEDLTTPVVATNIKTANGSGTAAAVTMNAAGAVANRFLVGIANNGGQTVTEHYAELADVARFTPAVGLETQASADGSDTAASGTLAASVTGWAIIGIEITSAGIDAAAAQASGGGVAPTTSVGSSPPNAAASAAAPIPAIVIARVVAIDVPPAIVRANAIPPVGVRTRFRIAGIYCGQTYPGGNGIIPTPPPRPPYETPRQVRIIRELPPTRQVVTIQTPRGYSYRWASDERNGGNIPSGVRNSSAAPGGYESFDAVLSRDPAVTYSDLEPMSTIRTEGVDGSEIGEYRLEATPDTSGDQMAISPSAVGWQSALNDIDAQSLLIIDRDLSHWGSQSLVQRQEDLRNGATTWPPSSGKSYAVAGGFDVSAGNPATMIASLDLPTQDVAPDATKPWNLLESMYDGGAGVIIGQIKFGYKTGGGFGPGWMLNLLLWKTTWQFPDGGAGAWAGASGLSGSGDVVVDAPDTNHGWRRAVMQMYYPGALTEDGKTKIDAGFVDVRVIGAHGLTLYVPSHDDYLAAVANGYTDSEAEYQRMTEGFLASDICKYIVQSFAPMLRCDDSTVQPSTFIIPQALHQGMKPGDMITDTLKYGSPPPDWFVWGKRTFYLHERGARGNHWRARTGAAKLTETGADITKLFNAIYVKYTDVSGVDVIVGPPGPTPPATLGPMRLTSPSNVFCVADRTYGPGGDVDTLDTRLIDNSPDNPLNQLRDYNGDRMMKMGLLTLSSPVANPDAAAKIGHDYLVESLAISRAGQATITGFIEDARTGMLHPYHAIKGGDDIEFIDANDTSARRIQHVDQDDGTRTATLSLDSPPDTLSGLLERMGAQIIPLGLS